MGSRAGISSNFSVSSGGASSSEVDAFRLLLDSDLCADVVAITQKTPAELICEHEERDEALQDRQDTRKEAVAGLLSFIFKPVRNMLPSVSEVSIRVFILCYLVSPQLLNAMSLSDIGKIIGEAFGTPDLSRQTLSARTKKLSATLNIKARSMKSQTSNDKYSALAKERWADRKQAEREERIREYQRNWREENKERKRELDRAYYLANRTRILQQRKKQRRRNK